MMMPDTQHARCSGAAERCRRATHVHYAASDSTRHVTSTMRFYMRDDADTSRRQIVMPPVLSPRATSFHYAIVSRCYAAAAHYLCRLPLCLHYHAYDIVFIVNINYATPPRHTPGQYHGVIRKNIVSRQSPRAHARLLKRAFMFTPRHADEPLCYLFCNIIMPPRVIIPCRAKDATCNIVYAMQDIFHDDAACRYAHTPTLRRCQRHAQHMRATTLSQTRRDAPATLLSPKYSRAAAIVRCSRHATRTRHERHVADAPPTFCRRASLANIYCFIYLRVNTR